VSNLARLVGMYAAATAAAERLTEQISHVVMAILQGHALGLMTKRATCSMMMRGVESQNSRW